ncbi:hypothetical protein T01_6451, partial [Trichinella spiralis]
LCQSSSVSTHPDCVLVLVPFTMDYVMMLVPLATLVHMDIKAFPSRPSVPLFITYGIFPFALDTVLSHVHISLF